VIRSAAWLLVPAVCLPLACDLLGRRSSDQQPAGQASADAAQVQASGAALPSASAAARAAASYPRREVEAGSCGDGTWLPAFSLEHQGGNERLAHARALDFCRRQGKSLCTEGQWQRACSLDRQLAQLETWTLSVEGSQAVVLGGDGTCSRRQVAAPDETSPMRVAVCCERAVGIRTSNRHASFLTSSTQRLLEYERAIRDRRASKLRELLDDPVVFDGREQARDQVVATLESQPRDSWTAIDRCQVDIEKDGSETRLVSDCKIFNFAAGVLSTRNERIVHGGAESRIQLVGSPEHMPLLAGEKKERARRFLGLE
jgi:hypothetical protein